jgi:hypothetical protein
MKKLLLVIILILYSCKNNPLSEGIFSGNSSNFIGYNLKFIDDNQAILFLPNKIVCNKHNINQIELNVKKIDNNAIMLYYSNKDFKEYNLIEWAEYCLNSTPLLKRIKWEESYVSRYGYVPKRFMDNVSINPTAVSGIQANQVLDNNDELYMRLWRVAYDNGYKHDVSRLNRVLHKNNEALSDIYELAIKKKELFKDEYGSSTQFKKYNEISFKEFKTLLDIDTIQIINENYLNIVKHTEELSLITNVLINKILIVKNLEKKISIGIGDKVLFEVFKK